jgi:hypothetical protein
MNSQACKYVNTIPPGAIKDDASFTPVSIDTLGYDYAELIVLLGSTDIAMAALKVQESDDDSNYADVTGLVFGTSDNIAGSTSALPTADDDNKVEAFWIDLRPRKRYLKIIATAGNGSNGTYLAAAARLSRAKEAPATAAEAGCDEILRV